MIALFILVVLVYVLIIFVLVIVDALILVGIVVVAEVAHIVSRLPFLSEPILGLTHLVVFLSAEHCVFIFSVIVEYLFFLSLFLLLLKGFNNFCLLLPPLSVL